jgi:3alpha(or 20beta)-hydroxysteroid dehydrogenase
MGRLNGKVAIITGAAMGMGAAQARLFAAEGAKVVLADVDAAVETVARELGDAALSITHDVGDETSWERVVALTEQRFGFVNILVNTAGIYDALSLSDTTLDSHERQVRVNQRGVFLGMRFVIEPMKRSGGGAIVNIASGAALRGMRNMFAYSATKWAVRGMTACAAGELAPFGIRVNCIYPGMIDTRLLKSNPGLTPDLIRQIVPMGRAGRPEEIAYATLFLASDEASYVSGADLAVDGAVMAV